MFFWFFLIFSCSDPQYSVSLTTCTITGDGTVDIDSYHASGPYAKYTVINIGTDITSIGNKCFSYSSELTTVNFLEPSNLISLGEYVFDTCPKLTSLKLPESVQTISPYLLRACSSIKSFYIGPNIKSISIPIIYGSKTFKSFQVHDDNNNYSNDDFGALYNKDKTILYTVPSGCDESYEIPKTVKELYSHCFHGQQTLKELFIPNNVELLDTWICQYNDYATTMIFEKDIQITKIQDHVFSYWYSVTSIILPVCITALPNYAFYNCKDLETVYIPKNVETIPTTAFTGCNSLKNVTISNENSKFTSINGIIYSKNKDQMLIIPTMVDNVTIPKECNSIPNTGFRYATSLTSINIEDGNQVYNTDGQIIYQDNIIICCIGGVSNVNVKESTTQINTYAFAYQSKIELIDLSKTQISIIKPSSFISSNIKSISFPSSLILIESYAFRYCKSLKTINFHQNTLKLNISINCFEECVQIASISFPPKINYLFEGSFTN